MPVWGRPGVRIRIGARLEEGLDGLLVEAVSSDKESGHHSDSRYRLYFFPNSRVQ